MDATACPRCGADLGIQTGLHEVAELTAALIPPTFPCPGCKTEWMLGEEGEPGAVDAGGIVLVPVSP